MDLKNNTEAQNICFLWHFYEDTSIFGSTIEEHYELLTFLVGQRIINSIKKIKYFRVDTFIIVSTCKKKLK